MTFNWLSRCFIWAPVSKRPGAVGRRGTYYGAVCKSRRPALSTNDIQSAGVCVLQAGQLGDAEELPWRSLSIRETKLGLDDFGVADTLFELSVCVRKMGRLQEAGELLRRCRATKESILGPMDVGLSTTMRRLGVCLGKFGPLGWGCRGCRMNAVCDIKPSLQEVARVYLG